MDVVRRRTSPDDSSRCQELGSDRRFAERLVDLCESTPKPFGFLRFSRRRQPSDRYDSEIYASLGRDGDFHRWDPRSDLWSPEIDDTEGASGMPACCRTVAELGCREAAVGWGDADVGSGGRA